MNPLEAAQELANTTIPELLKDAGLKKVTTTVDLLTVPAALHNGPVIFIQPPELDFTTYDAGEAKWELVVIAGPPHDALKAWAAIVDIQEALRVPLSLDKGFPSTFEHPSQPAHPAYIYEFTDSL